MIQLQFRLNFLGHDLQNCTLRARGSFRGKTYGVRFFFNSATVSGFERKLFGFMVKTVRQPCQKCTFSASGAKRRKFCFEKLYQFWTIFWLQGGSFRTLNGILQKFRQNRNFCFQEIIWIKTCLSSKKSSSCLLTLSKPYSDFWLADFGNYYQNCNYLSIATSSWTTFSLKKRCFFQILFCL